MDKLTHSDLRSADERWRISLSGAASFVGRAGRRNPAALGA
jgi:hypothetical protein